MQNSHVVDKAKENKKAYVFESILDWLQSAVIALIVVALVYSVLFRVVNVSGDSMTNTLQSGEKLVLSGIILQPNYGDIVVIQRENDTPLIKRVIGLPGDTIFINDSNGIVYRNGEALDEPYVRGGFTPSKGLNTEYVMPEDGIFALGDNRDNSLDSRMLRDRLKMRDVVGVVICRLNPLESLRNGE